MKHTVKWTLALLVFFIAGTVFYSGVRVAAEAVSPSKGRVPAEAVDATGRIKAELIPDFVVALKRDGSEAGYVSKHGLFKGVWTTEQKPVAPNLPVVDESLERVVGHMVPGRGFVAIGSKIEDTPPLPIEISEVR